MIITIQKQYLDQVCNYAKQNGFNTVTVCKDFQNAYYGQYMDSVVLEEFTNEKDTLKKSVYSVLHSIVKEASVIRDHGLKARFVFYTDVGRNFLNEFCVPTWKQSRKKQILDMHIKDPSNAAAHDYMHNVFIKTAIVIRSFFKYLPNVYFYSLKNIDSDYVPYLHKYLFPDSVYVITSVDKDYIHMVAEDSRILRYYFLSKNRRLESKYDGYKYIFKNHKITDSHRRMIFYNYPVFHALIGDESDNMKSLITRKGISFWTKALDGKITENSLQEFRQYVIDDFPFHELLNKEVEWSGTIPVRTYWDVYKLRQFIVDFYFTTVMTLPPNLLLDSDARTRNKLLSTYHFMSPYLDSIHEEINNVVNKYEVLSVNEAQNVIESLGIRDNTLAPILVS